MKTSNNQISVQRNATPRTNGPSDFAFDVWVNDQVDFLSNIADHDDIGFGSFDDNWIVSAGDLFGKMDLPTNESVNYYDDAA